MRPAAVALAAALALAACDADPAIDDAARADGPLPAAFDVAGLAPTWVGRVTLAELDGATGGAIAPGRPAVAIRTLRLDGVPAQVLIDAASLAAIVALDADVARTTRPAEPSELAGTRYVAGLTAARGAPLDRLPESARDPGQARFVLTVDLCQSARPWERRFFEDLVALGAALKAPIPVGIALTGRWATAHPTELAQLLAWDASGALDVTWVDHSYDHPVKDARGEYRFLTDPAVDFPAQVLRLEALLIAQGALPSPFFRFPGLTHDSDRLEQLAQLSLFALDANAWLAKGQPIADGGLVLVHGNGNERAGIVRWDTQIAAWEPKFRTGEARIVSTDQLVP